MIDNFSFFNGRFIKLWLLTIRKKLLQIFNKVSLFNLNTDEFSMEMKTFKFQSNLILVIFHKISLKKGSMWILDSSYKIWQFKNIHPNIQTELRKFLKKTLTTVTCDYSFSKFNLIKSYFRYSLRRERNSFILIIAIEKEVP